MNPQTRRGVPQARITGIWLLHPGEHTRLGKNGPIQLHRRALDKPRAPFQRLGAGAQNALHRAGSPVVYYSSEASFGVIGEQDICLLLSLPRGLLFAWLRLMRIGPFFSRPVVALFFL